MATPNLINLSDPIEVRTRLREQRAELMTLLTLVERRLGRMVFRVLDEAASEAMNELVKQLREHLLLASFDDREPTVPGLPAGDTEPPEPFAGVPCGDCQGSGQVETLMPTGHCLDVEPAIQVCPACMGVGAHP